ncbi:MAG: hypothetical protein KDC66_12575 [Phaeodactylibacter sp.]|nr:hypothetical protein [Phaeodactylibacter sp.]MCB9275172.1 glycosyltransferase [Lewinellaceae bacterium]
MLATPRVLVTPLDWGLGHATRCVPVIRELQRQGAEPVLATAGRAAAYLKAEFPGLEHILFPAYDIRYPTANMYWNMGLQAVKLLRVIRQEHELLQAVIRQRNVRAVISDNRFGCFSSLAPSVFITHQSNLAVPSFPAWWAANKANQFFMRQYREWWLPDYKPEGFSGALSRPLAQLPYRCLGILSRFTPMQCDPTYDVLALLSGPEPQRSRLEQVLVQQLRFLPHRVLLVQGKTESYEEFEAAPNIKVVSFLNQAGLQQALTASKQVVCRSGYSSLMDLAATGKKALLIPTPGQPEQQYLAMHLQSRGICPFQHQHSVNLTQGLARIPQYRGFSPPMKTGEGLEAAVRALLGRVA